MHSLLPFVLALSVGFSHAFEADHLVAVSSIVTRRTNVLLALKDGIFWGLGHTSTILLIGGAFILGKVALGETDFRYLEAGVGIMLVVLGVGRLVRLAGWAKVDAGHLVNHVHTDGPHEHGLAYGVGLLHGLAGSGVLILSVLTQINGAGADLLYLLLFGVGSIGGMMVAAGVFSLPFSVRLTSNPLFRILLVVLSSVMCLSLGAKMIYENLIL